MPKSTKQQKQKETSDSLKGKNKNSTRDEKRPVEIVFLPTYKPDRPKKI